MSGSRMPGFYKLSIEQRHEELRRRGVLSDEEALSLGNADIGLETADHMVENVVSTYALPMALGLNFLVNGRDYLVPMCIEEPSVVAAASNAARLARAGGGFRAEADESLVIGHIQLTRVADTGAGRSAIMARRAELLAECDELVPSLVRRGGGAREIEVRVLEESAGDRTGMLVVHLIVDCCDAMGANIVNSLAEMMAGRLAALAAAHGGLRILSNLGIDAWCGSAAPCRPVRWRPGSIRGRR